jgi:hypothetical protein
MSVSMFEKGTSILSRACLLVGAILAILPVVGVGCGAFTESGTSEGNRCNPLLSHDECSSGLVCTGRQSAPAVPFCPENYCCSVDSKGDINSTNPNCQPGCNGGAASICTASKDPGACAFAGGASLSTAMAMDEDAGAAAPPSPDGGPVEGGD